MVVFSSLLTKDAFVLVILSLDKKPHTTGHDKDQHMCLRKSLKTPNIQLAIRYAAIAISGIQP